MFHRPDIDQPELAGLGRESGFGNAMASRHGINDMTVEMRPQNFLHPVAGPAAFILVIIAVFQTIFTAATPLVSFSRQ